MLSFPQVEARFLLPGPVGELEVLTVPIKSGVAAKSAVAVICHPHPLHGGTMNNKVVTTLMRVFHDLGLRTVRFNFRGVGASTGAYAEGVGELDDVLAVVEWVKASCPGNALWLAGFSFGAAVAMHAATRLDVAQLVCVAPPVPRFNLTTLPPITCPWLVVQGEQDDVVVPADVFAFVASLNPSPTLIRVPNAGHFFHGQLLTLRHLLEEALR